MMYSSCIQQPKNNRFIQLHEWQKSFCQDNHCAAILLSYFSSWHDWKIENNSDYRHFNDIAQDDCPPHQNAYLFFTMADLVDALMGLFGKKCISEGLALLASLGVITIHKNPNPRYCFDRTKYFKFYPEVCNKWLQEHDLLNKSDEDESQLIDYFDNIKMDNQEPNNANPSSEKGQPLPKNSQAVTDNTKSSNVCDKSQLIDFSDNAKMDNRERENGQPSRKNGQPITDNNTKINENWSINTHNDAQLIDFSDNAKMDNRERENGQPSGENGQPSRKNGQPITDNTNYKTNYKKQSINARAREEVPIQNLPSQEPRMIIAALIEKGMPLKRFYPDSIDEIYRLRQAGATVATFIQAYEISAQATQGRGFGLRYLVKVVHELLAKSKRYGVIKGLSPPVQKDNFCETVYESDIRNALNWMKGEETCKQV